MAWLPIESCLFLSTNGQRNIETYAHTCITGDYLSMKSLISLLILCVWKTTVKSGAPFDNPHFEEASLKPDTSVETKWNELVSTDNLTDDCQKLTIQDLEKILDSDLNFGNGFETRLLLLSDNRCLSSSLLQLLSDAAEKWFHEISTGGSESENTSKSLERLFLNAGRIKFAKNNFPDVNLSKPFCLSTQLFQMEEPSTFSLGWKGFSTDMGNGENCKFLTSKGLQNILTFFNIDENDEDNAKTRVNLINSNNCLAYLPVNVINETANIVVQSLQELRDEKQKINDEIFKLLSDESQYSDKRHKNLFNKANDIDKHSIPFFENQLKIFAHLDLEKLDSSKLGFYVLKQFMDERNEYASLPVDPAKQYIFFDDAPKEPVDLKKPYWHFMINHRGSHEKMLQWLDNIFGVFGNNLIYKGKGDKNDKETFYLNVLQHYFILNWLADQVFASIMNPSNFSEEKTKFLKQKSSILHEIFRNGTPEMKDNVLVVEDFLRGFLDHDTFPLINDKIIDRLGLDSFAIGNAIASRTPSISLPSTGSKDFKYASIFIRYLHGDKDKQLDDIVAMMKSLHNALSDLPVLARSLNRFGDFREIANLNSNTNEWQRIRESELLPDVKASMGVIDNMQFWSELSGKRPDSMALEQCGSLTPQVLNYIVLPSCPYLKDTSSRIHALYNSGCLHLMLKKGAISSSLWDSFGSGVEILLFFLDLEHLDSIPYQLSSARAFLEASHMWRKKEDRLLWVIKIRQLLPCFLKFMNYSIKDSVYRDDPDLHDKLRDITLVILSRYIRIINNTFPELRNLLFDLGPHANKYLNENASKDWRWGRVIYSMKLELDDTDRTEKELADAIGLLEEHAASLLQSSYPLVMTESLKNKFITQLLYSLYWNIASNESATKIITLVILEQLGKHGTDDAEQILNTIFASYQNQGECKSETRVLLSLKFFS